MTKLAPELAWGATEHLLAATVDSIAAGNWQRSGGKGQRPKPVPRPSRPSRLETLDPVAARKRIAEADAEFTRRYEKRLAGVVNDLPLDGLLDLPGVGPALAEAIAEARPFATVADLGDVSGVGPSKLAAIRAAVIRHAQEVTDAR